MNNIVKKIKNVNPLAMFAKLVGLAVVFSVVSCGCKKESKDNLVATFSTEVKNGEKINLKLEAKDADVEKLGEYKIKVVSAVAYEDETFAKQAGDDISKTITIKEDGKTLQELTNVEDLAKGSSKDINLQVQGHDNLKAAKIVISIMKGSEAISTAKDKEIKWSK
jgi:hypothetical protein